MQYLEGDAEEIKDLYKKIEKDNHHNNVFLYAYTPLEKRIFSCWKMGFKDLDRQLNFHTAQSMPDQEIFRRIIVGYALNNMEESQLLRLFFEAA